MRASVWLAETRPAFLLLSLVVVFLGTSVAAYEGFFEAFYFVLAAAGLVLLHASVNMLNDYFDFRKGIDMVTQRTPFSGGSGILPAGVLDPIAVYRVALLYLFMGLLVGAYFAVVRPLILPIVLAGAVSIYWYTTFLARHMLGEVSAGLGLGALPVLGSYYVQTASFTLAALAASVPSFILVFNLLLLNEFPDMEADARFGRMNLVIVAGKRNASKLYLATNVILYAWIAGSIAAGLMPPTCAVAFLTLPISAKAVSGALGHRSDGRMRVALAANVASVLLTQILLGAGLLAALMVR